MAVFQGQAWDTIVIFAFLCSLIEYDSNKKSWMFFFSFFKPLLYVRLFKVNIYFRHYIWIKSGSPTKAGPGPWFQSQSLYISGPGFGPGSGPRQNIWFHHSSHSKCHNRQLCKISRAWVKFVLWTFTVLSEIQLLSWFVHNCW